MLGGVFCCFIIIFHLVFFKRSISLCSLLLQVWTNKASFCLPFNGTWDYGREDIQASGNKAKERIAGIFHDFCFLMKRMLQIGDKGGACCKGGG